MGTNAGTDFDFLTVVGNASLGGTVQILDQSAGAIDVATPFTWNLIAPAQGFIWTGPRTCQPRAVSPSIPSRIEGFSAARCWNSPTASR